MARKKQTITNKETSDFTWFGRKRTTYTTSLVSSFSLTIRVYNYKDIYKEKSKISEKISISVWVLNNIFLPKYIRLHILNNIISTNFLKI